LIFSPCGRVTAIPVGARRVREGGRDVVSAVPDLGALVATDLRRAQALIAGARRIVVLTGAGMSAESGIPTFRQARAALWADFDPMQLASPEGFRADPPRVWSWYAWRREKVAGALPHAGYFALAAAAQCFEQMVLITQNVDGLHERAGSRNVIELHGNILRTTCFAQCGVRIDDPGALPPGVPPRCPRCGSHLRPDVVWFGEMLDAARRANDLPRTLKLERELIDLARDRFELISHLEHVDLERLREDRNRCAHPSLISDEVKFSASAELARTHIRAAVTHLLQQAPAQGKFALERLTREVSSEYFPTSVEEAAETLSVGPLRRPRESLVSNFIIVLFKWVVGDDLGYKAHARIMSALEATHQLHPQIFAGVLRDKVNVIVRKVEDENLLRVLRVVFRIQEVWEHLASDVQNRLENYVSHLPDLYHLDEALDFPPLAKQARVRLRLASVKELNDCLFFSLHELIAEKFIDHYLAAKNYAEATKRRS